MKRQLAVLVMLTLIIFSLTACGISPRNKEKKSKEILQNRYDEEFE